MFDSLNDKRALVTGGSGTIGSAIARQLASYGARIGVHYCRNRESAERVRAAIAGQHVEASCFQADLTDPKMCAGLVRDFVERYGGIDILVNNAGAVIGYQHFLELDPASWDLTLALNARAPFLLSREAFKHMQAQGGGRIINISSVAARYGGSAQSVHYGAAKAALEAMTVGLARAGAPHQILVNAIQAGFIDTPFHEKTGRSAIEERIKLIPLKRPGHPDDVARMAVFLASEAGAFITGQTLTVSGGD